MTLVLLQHLVKSDSPVTLMRMAWEESWVASTADLYEAKKS